MVKYLINLPKLVSFLIEGEQSWTQDAEVHAAEVVLDHLIFHCAVSGDLGLVASHVLHELSDDGLYTPLLLLCIAHQFRLFLASELVDHQLSDMHVTLVREVYLAAKHWIEHRLSMRLVVL